MSGWFRILFLLSSFGPLYAVVAVELYVQRDKAGGWPVFALAAASAVALFLWLQRDFKSKSPVHTNVKIVSALDESILTYLLTYLPPLMIDDFSKIEKTAPAILFYGILTFLMLRTDTIYVNPFFIWFGYRIYRVELPSRRTAIIVTRKPEVVGEEHLNLYEIESSRFYYAA